MIQNKRRRTYHIRFIQYLQHFHLNAQKISMMYTEIKIT